MERWLIVAALGLSGCVAVAPVVAPAPAPEAVAAEEPAPGAESERPAQVAVAVAPDTARRAAAIADSARDEEMLDQLHEVAAALPDGADEADLTALFDINVARYTQHDRVQFYLDFFQGQARERMTVWLSRLPVYEPMIRAALTAKGLPSDLVYLALIESGYSNTAVSRSKAVGMWQFMRGTAGDYGLRVTNWIDERRDPIKATSAAANYLADLTARFGGSHYLAAAAYNGGGGRVSRGLRMLGAGATQNYFDGAEAEEELAADLTGDDRFFHLSDSRYLHRETKNYVPKLIAAAMIAKQPEKYGFPSIPSVEPYAVDSIPVTEPTSLEVIAKAGDLPIETVTSLNRRYVRGMTPPGEVHWVRVPVGTAVSVTEALAAVPSEERVPAFGHTVGRRETMRSVARRYGISIAELVAFNGGLKSNSKLAAGSMLRIPGRARAAEAERSEPVGRAGSGRVHRVARGETLGSIARRYRVSVTQLLRWNDIGLSTPLAIGQRIRLGASAPARSAGKVTAAKVHVVRRGETLSAVARR
ncbi:MAG: LysM peptidoglycan-binding domain-containing protein, partial [Gemmatimonadetes bacterium]|nr:LysM peptidoglycan-binding domain-containing protein [Gemmatimonadota bacterium]